MATYSRNTSLSALTQPQTQPELESKSLSTVLVKSLQTAVEGMNSNGLTSSDKNLDALITKGINNSVLSKSQKTPSQVKNQDKQLNDLLKKESSNREKSEKKNRDDLAKFEKESILRRETHFKETAEKALSGLNEFSKNPLKSFATGIDKGIKGMFGIFDKSLGDIGGDVKKAALTVTAPARAVKNLFGGSKDYPIDTKVTKADIVDSSKAGTSDLDSLVKNDNVAKAEVSSSERKSKNPLDDLIKKEDEQIKQAEVESKQSDADRDELNKLTEDGNKEAKTQNMFATIKFGLIVGSVVGIAAAIPVLVGTVGEFVNRIPYYLDEIKIKIGLLFNGQNSIPNQIQRNLKASLAKLANVEGDGPIAKLMRSVGEEFAYGASDELLAQQESQKQETYQKFKDIGFSDEQAKNAIKDPKEYGGYSLKTLQKKTGIDVSSDLSAKDSKEAKSRKLFSKDLASWTDDDVIWFKNKLPTAEKREQFQKMYDAVIAAQTLNKINNEVANSKDTLIDYDKDKKEAKEADKIEGERLMTASLVDKYMNGEMSQHDFEQIGLKNEGFTEWYKEHGDVGILKANSKFEQIVERGQDVTKAYGQAGANLVNNITGKQTIEFNMNSTNTTGTAFGR